MNKMKKAFKGLEAPTAVCLCMQDKLKEFNQYVPLIVALRNPGLRERHWAQISGKLDMTLQPDPMGSLRKYLEMDLLGKVDILGEVSDQATKEYSLERALEAQVVEWKPQIYNLLEQPDRGSYILSGVDELQQLLDDHIMKTQTIRVRLTSSLSRRCVSNGRKSCSKCRTFSMSGSNARRHGCIWHLSLAQRTL